MIRDVRINAFISVLILFFSAHCRAQENDIQVYYSLKKALKNPDKVEALILSNTGEQGFPTEILKFKNLQYLILDSNQIDIIPEQINELSKLEVLSLGHNNIEKLPATLGDLTELHNLYLDDNKINELPDEFFKLKNLEILFLSKNNLTSLSPMFKWFPLLKKLNVSYNKIAVIPEEMGFLSNLRSFSCSYNNISELPASLFSLSSLEYLFLSGNAIGSLPPEIENLKELEVLTLDSNNLSALPKEIGRLENLAELYIDGNDITALPSEIGNITKLEILFIGNNPLSDLPISLDSLNELIYLSVRNLKFKNFPQVLYDLQNRGIKIIDPATKDLFNARLLLSQARNRKLTGEYSESVEKYKELIGLDTNNIVAIKELSFLYFENDQFDKVLPLCQKALLKKLTKTQQDSFSTLYDNSLKKENQLPLAIDSIKDDENSDDGDALSLFELGENYFDHKEYDTASVTFLKAIHSDPVFSKAHFYMALIALKLKHDKFFVLPALQFIYLNPTSTKAKTMMPFVMLRLKMKTGHTRKDNRTSYEDEFIIRDEDQEIIYKSENPMMEVLTAMMIDLSQSDLVMADSSEKDTSVIEGVKNALHINQNNVEIFQDELKNICNTMIDTIASDEKDAWEIYLPYFNDIIKNNYLETFAYMINSYRSEDDYITQWLQDNRIKVEEFNTWVKNYKWVK
jgi:Leucine-rich repeat (LRR) protein